MNRRSLLKGILGAPVALAIGPRIAALIEPAAPACVDLSQGDSITSYWGNQAPLQAAVGDVWFNPPSYEVHRFNGASWIRIQN